MNKWIAFYRILKIPENIIEPDYYDLFNLTPEKCNKKMVDNALRQMKIKIRQHIPSSKFIPFALQFEKEILEPAANILRDELERIEYTNHLSHKKIKHEQKIELVKKIRAILDETLDENGMLDFEQKDRLAKRLQKN